MASSVMLSGCRWAYAVPKVMAMTTNGLYYFYDVYQLLIVTLLTLHGSYLQVSLLHSGQQKHNIFSTFVHATDEGYSSYMSSSMVLKTMQNIAYKCGMECVLFDIDLILALSCSSECS